MTGRLVLSMGVLEAWHFLGAVKGIEYGSGSWGGGVCGKGYNMVGSLVVQLHARSVMSVAAFPEL